MGRDWRVDTLRGYFLVCMTLGHFANPLARFTEYTFGYASSPDGFVFLSGLVSCWVYLPLANRRRSAAMLSKVYRRAVTIYLTHLALVVASIAAVFYSGMAAEKMRYAWQTFVAGATLTNQSGFDRILPMYVVFLAFTPVMLEQFSAGRAWVIGTVSAALWVGAQFGWGEWGFVANANQGNFNLFAWQAYFVAGQYLGYRGVIRREVSSGEAGLRKSRGLLVICAVVAALLMVDRHMELWARQPLLGFSGHPDHNPARLLDAICLGYLVWRVPRSVVLALMKLRVFQFLNLLGRHSLQVFAFSMLVTRFEAHTAAGLSLGARWVVTLATVLALGLPARVHEFMREGGLERAPAPSRFGGAAVESSVRVAP